MDGTNLSKLTTLRMELGVHGGPEMKVTSMPTAAQTFKNQIFQTARFHKFAIHEVMDG